MSGAGVIDFDDAEYIQQFLSQAAEMTPNSLLQEYPRVRRILEKGDPVQTAAIFGAMLLDKDLQSNCVRLEALVHMAMACGRASEKLPRRQLAECFNELRRGIVGRMEDPAEDVFVSLVTTSRGSFRVLEGIWETGTFYLQRFVNIVDQFPDHEPFRTLREQVFSLLKLSEEVCERSGLIAYSVGGTEPLETIDKNVSFKADWKSIAFDRKQLSNLGLKKSDLSDFLLPHRRSNNLGQEAIGESPLQTTPIVEEGSRIFLILPTAISYAIRCHVIAALDTYGFKGSLKKALIGEYCHLLHQMSILGPHRGNLDVPDDSESPWANIIAPMADGHFIHFLFFNDTLNQIDQTGIAGKNSIPNGRVKAITKDINGAISHCAALPGFRAGMTLLVYCGVGRQLVLPIPKHHCKNWEVEFISIADLATLSSDIGYKSLNLWKTLRNVSRLEEMGVAIENHNGLLNLLAYTEAHQGHLLDHENAPEEFRENGGTIHIAPSFVLNLRRRIAVEADRRCISTVSGEYQEVRLANSVKSAEGNLPPVYVATRMSSEDGLPIVCPTPNRIWWCNVVPTAIPEDDVENWNTIHVWLPRIVRVLDAAFGTKLPSCIRITIEIAASPNNPSKEAIASRDEVESETTVSIQRADAQVTVEVGMAFYRGLMNPENISERVLVAAISRGIAELGGVALSPYKLQAIENEIVGSMDARHRHAFPMQNCREFFFEALSSRTLIEADMYDEANLSLGVAFLAESREGGRSLISEKRGCTELLNTIVQSIENDVCLKLQGFNRAAFIEVVLLNYEKAMYDRGLWNRTSRAMVALNHDKEEAHRKVIEHDFKLNSVLSASRILIEMAICECTQEGEELPTSVDLSQLMVRVNAIYKLGGWSSAIHLDAMPPTLHVTPLGDVQADNNFEDSILKPFAHMSGRNQVQDAIASYESKFEVVRVGERASSLEEAFEAAWEEEFSFRIEDLRVFLDGVEDLGINRGSPVVRILRDKLVESSQIELSPSTIQAILTAFTLTARPSWRAIPSELRDKDIQPWLFRRELSAVRRPFFQIGIDDNAEIIFAPGMVRENIVAILHRYHEGYYRDWQCRTPRMRAWKGARTNQRGSDFAKNVKDRLNELQWSTSKAELQLTEVLKIRKDEEFGDLKQYGDVDVLAWNVMQKRVLLIECKDLHFHKTPGEVAEQLSDYRGKIKSNGKPDDLLKHLRRVEVLTARKEQLCHFLKIPSDVVIEGWVVFKNPVPMLFAWEDVGNGMKVTTFEELSESL